MFRCFCGKEFQRELYRIKNKSIRSCGCLRPNWDRERVEEMRARNGDAPIKKGVEYAAWACMKNRCYDVTSASYPRYGGRGIKVCDRWKYDFLNFKKDMGLRPPGHSLDRIDVNGNYEPGNCRWATRKEQARNRRRSFHIEYRGERKLFIEWCEQFDVKYPLAYRRLKAGWSVDDALTKPVKGRSHAKFGLDRS